VPVQRTAVAVFAPPFTLQAAICRYLVRDSQPAAPPTVLRECLSKQCGTVSPGYAYGLSATGALGGMHIASRAHFQDAMRAVQVTIDGAGATLRVRRRCTIHHPGSRVSQVLVLVAAALTGETA
jgi:hypothetical protein